LLPSVHESWLDVTKVAPLGNLRIVRTGLRTR